MYISDRVLNNMTREELRIRNIFERVYNGRTNWFTPGYYRFGQAGHYLYELSTGKFMRGSTMFGVTVLTADGTKTELSECFTDDDRNKALAAAEEYIKKLASLDKPDPGFTEGHGTHERTNSQRSDNPSQRNNLVAPGESQAAHLGGKPSPISDTLGSQAPRQD
jgi:hypothetical protein